MATLSSILAWEIPWTEEPGGLQSMGVKKRLGHHLESQTRLSDFHLLTAQSLWNLGLASSSAQLTPCHPSLSSTFLGSRRKAPFILNN